jgi:hypothetical protein
VQPEFRFHCQQVQCRARPRRNKYSIHFQTHQHSVSMIQSRSSIHTSRAVILFVRYLCSVPHVPPSLCFVQAPVVRWRLLDSLSHVSLCSKTSSFPLLLLAAAPCLLPFRDCLLLLFTTTCLFVDDSIQDCSHAVYRTKTIRCWDWINPCSMN